MDEGYRTKSSTNGRNSRAKGTSWMATTNRRFRKWSIRREFTDYLNVFEFLGYLSESKQIGRSEILRMFDYYLKNLRKHPTVLNPNRADSCAEPRICKSGNGSFLPRTCRSLDQESRSNATD